MKLYQVVVFFLLLMQSCLISHGVHAAGFSGRICVVPERAIVFYDNKLYLAEPRTAVISKRNKEEAFVGITSRLTDQVQLIRTLSATVAKGSHDTVTVGAVLKLDGADAYYYSSPTTDDGVTLIKGRAEEGALWRDEKVGGRGLPDDSHTQDHTLEHARVGRFIAVSSEETVIKERGGNLTLHALKLGEKGEKKDAARFQTIEISGP
jgi:hypothetical protein